MLALEIHPSGLRALDERSDRYVESPVALHAGGGALLTGELALRRARIEPRAFRNRFWEDLSRAPLSPSLAGFASNVDLAYAHLKALLSELEPSPEATLLSVAPGLDREALALLLGVAEACGLVVQSLADAAVAAGSDALLSRGTGGPERGRAGTWWCVDIGPGSAWAAPLELAADRRWLRRAGDPVEIGGGFDALQDAWLSRVAARFVEDTRFDPLHSAEGEQSLFDLLAECAARLRETDAPPVVLRLGDSEHRTQVSRGELVRAADGVFDEWRVALAKHVAHPGQGSLEGLQILLSAGLDAIPGAGEVFSEASELCILRADAALRGSLAWAPRTRAAGAGAGVERLLRLGETSEAPPRVAVKPPAAPTHLLLGHRALPLEASRGEGVAAGLTIWAGRTGLEVGVRSTPAARPLGVLLPTARGPELSLEPGVRARCDEVPIETGRVLRLGDRLSFEDVEGEVRLIYVGDAGGS